MNNILDIREHSQITCLWVSVEFWADAAKSQRILDSLLLDISFFDRILFGYRNFEIPIANIYINRLTGSTHAFSKLKKKYN